MNTAGRRDYLKASHCSAPATTRVSSGAVYGVKTAKLSTLRSHEVTQRVYQAPDPRIAHTRNPVRRSLSNSARCGAGMQADGRRGADVQRLFPTRLGDANVLLRAGL